MDTRKNFNEEGFREYELEDKVKLSGTEIYTDKADDSVVHVDVDGQSYQHAGTGKNLFNKRILADREKYTLGTYSASPTFQLKPNTVYVISAKEVKPSPEGYQLVLNVMNATNGAPLWGDSDYNSNILQAVFNRRGVGLSSLSKTFTTPDSGIISFSYFDSRNGQSPEGNWFTDVMIEPQLEEGSVATEFEPPAPTPDHPIEIHSLNDFDLVSQKSEGGKIDGIEVGGRNLLLDSGTRKESANYRLTVYDLSTSELTEDEEITITLKAKLGEHRDFFRFYNTAGHGSTIIGVIYKNEFDSNGVATKTFIWREWESNDTLQVYQNPNSSELGVSSVEWITLTRGNKSSKDWTPAPEDIKENDNHPLIDKINLSLSEPLRSVGDVKDRLFRDSDGLWKIERNVGEEVFENGDQWSNSYWYERDNSAIYGISSDSVSYMKQSGAVSFSHVITDNSINTNDSNGGLLSSNPRVRLRLRHEVIGATETSPSLFKEWLVDEYEKGTPLTIVYELATPAIETLEEELQDKLNNLRSFQDSNYVYTVNNSNDLEPNLHGTFKSKEWHYKNEIEPKFNKFVGIDPNKRKKGYKINLAKPNQQTIASINEAYGANYSIKLGNINEVTFNVPYFIDKLDKRVKNENIELIKEKMYTKISYNNNDEWMVIDTIEDVGSGDEKYMTVTAFTNVYETSNRKINELNLEVVNPEEYYDAVLNDVAWSIGTIDPLFKDIYRSVELSNTTVLEAIITGAETFGAVLDFDTENKKINLIDIDSRAKYRGLNINYSNFLQSINRKRSVDEMTTRLYVYGSEDLSIENVNPTGMRYLEDFTYFLYPFERDESKNVIKSSHYMSDELAHAILDKNELSKEYQPQIKAMQEEIDEETIEYINETTLLNELRFDETSISGLLDIAKATEDNDLILQRQSELAEIKTKISIKELTVDHISATIEDLERQIAQLQSQISVTSFSKELYDELSMYIIESEFRDDRYIDEEELYRDALKKFEESKSPNIVIEASIDNIIDSLEEDYYSDKVVLGDIARVTDKEMSVEMKSLITELSFDLDNNTCDVTIANGDIEKDGYDRILSVLYDTQSTTTMLENNKYKWDTVTDVKTEVDLMRDSEIDATRNRIKAGFRESVTIEDRGVILSNPDFPDEIVIMQAGVIALSTDGGENWSTSITPRGVMAETIIGKLVASNNLIVTNDSGSFRIDSDGLTVDMDSIKIMSGEGDTPENIVDSWNKMLITMDEFADDGKLNEYEKNQIARQWNSIAIAHSSMVEAIQNAYGPETPENQYPIEYEEYMESYEGLRRYLNDEIQSDGHTILDPLHRSETTNIDSDKYNKLVSDYEVSKDRFQTVIPLDFSQTFIEQTRKEISLNYVKNGEVATKLNLSEEGVRIDGRLLEINSETHFNDDLVMNAGLIRSADGAINIDLNAGVINLSRPLTINAVPVATEDFVEENLADAIKDIDVEYGITSDKNTPPSDWNTTPPAWQDGKYIWSRTITVYKNGVTEITDPVNITGATGSSGGIGQSGRSVKSIQEQYYLSTSPVDLENGSWLDNPPEWEEDRYIWTRSVITYENPSGVDRTDPVSISGQQGPKGEDGSDGKDAPTVKLSGKTQIIKVNENGQTTPSANFTVAGSSVNTVITTWRYSVDGGDFVVSLPIGVTRSGATITVNPNSVEFDTLTIRASDGRVSDDFTIARAVDGATGEDAYTIILTNESHTFAGNVLHAVPSSTTTDIIAYKGNVRVPVTIDSVTGMPTGMSNSISSNGTTNTRITFSVTDELADESGTVKLNLVVNGNHITKEFSFAVAYKGERGDKGDEGTGVSSVSVTYQNHSNGTTAPTGSWSNSPNPVKGTYLWARTITSYTDGEEITTYNVSYNATDGQRGPQGPQGGTGTDGTGVSGTEVRYSQSASGTTVPTSGWQTTPHNPIQGQYNWTRTIVSYTDGTKSTSYSTSYNAKDGQKGDKGDTGTGVKSAVVSYRNHTSGTVTPPTTGWVSTPPTPIKGQYMWTRTITTYTDNSEITTYSVAYNALDGQKGDTGATGGKGDEGTGISSTVIRYFQSTSGTTTPTGSGATTPPTPIQGQYNWTKTVITYTDGTSSTAWSTSYNAKDGQKGDKGDKGDTGDRGPQGTQGPKGDNGQSQWTHIRYSANSNGSSMTNTPVSTTKYIGIAVTNSASAPVYTGFTWSKYVGDNGSQGPQGPQGTQGVRGPAGANGQPTYTWVKYAEDKNGGGMSDYPEGKRFIGLAFNKTTATESTTASDYQWSEMPQNIEIGGRNYFVRMNINNIADVSNVLTSGSNWKGFSFPVEEGTQYTIHRTDTTNNRWRLYWVYTDEVEGSTTHTTAFSADSQESYVANTVEVPSGAKWGHLYLSNADSDGSTIPNIQIEKGNIATDWTEAPEDTQAKIDEKADTDLIDNIQGQLDDFVLVEGYETEIGEINQALQDYKELIESGEVATDEAVEDIKTLLNRTEAIENNLGEFTESWNFEVTEITMGEEGLFLGDNLTNMGIRIAPQVGETPPRIDFVDNGTIVAEITGQYMRINRGIFVQSAQIGEHQIETIAGGHTIWKWIPS